MEKPTEKYSKFPARLAGSLPRWCITEQSQSSPLQVINCKHCAVVERPTGNPSQIWSEASKNHVLMIFKTVIILGSLMADLRARKTHTHNASITMRL